MREFAVFIREIALVVQKVRTWNHRSMRRIAKQHPHLSNKTVREKRPAEDGRSGYSKLDTW